MTTRGLVSALTDRLCFVLDTWGGAISVSVLGYIIQRLGSPELWCQVCSVLRKMDVKLGAWHGCVAPRGAVLWGFCFTWDFQHTSKRLTQKTWTLGCFNPFSVGTVFRCQNLTSMTVLRRQNLTSIDRFGLHNPTAPIKLYIYNDRRPIA